MMSKGILVGLVILGLAMAGAASGKAPGKTFSYDYSFKTDTEPDGFRGLRWQTDIATLDPFTTMTCVAIIGPSAFYTKQKEDLFLGNAKVDEIIYEFWNGRFASVVIRTGDYRTYVKLRDYCFTKYGPGERSETYKKLDVQDFYWNGFTTKMYLTYSDIDRIGELSIYSIGILNRKQLIDTFVIKEKAKKMMEEVQRQKNR